MKINSIIKFQNNAHSTPITIDVVKITRSLHTSSTNGKTVTVGEMDLVHILRDYDKTKNELVKAQEIIRHLTR